MNRFAAQGLIAEALQGKQVMVVTTATREATGYFALLIDDAARVQRSGTGTSIRFDDASTIRIVTPADLRGRSADVVFLDSDIAAHALDDIGMYLTASTIAGHSGEVIRA